MMSGLLYRLRTCALLERETAQFQAVTTRGYAAAIPAVKIRSVALLSSNRGAAVSLHRYPSPDRSAYSPSGPITVRLQAVRSIFCRSSAQIRNVIGYHGECLMSWRASRVTSGAAWTTIKGLKRCRKRNHSLSRQLPYSVCQVASTMTRNVVLQVQQADLSQPNFWVQIPQHPLLSAAPQACSATTQGFAANLIARAPRGRINFENRRTGLSRVAVFCSGDER